MLSIPRPRHNQHELLVPARSFPPRRSPCLQLTWPIGAEPWRGTGTDEEGGDGQCCSLDSPITAKVVKQPPSPFLVSLRLPPARHSNTSLVQKAGKKFTFQIKQCASFSPRPMCHMLCDRADMQDTSSLLLYFNKALPERRRNISCISTERRQ